MGGFSHLAASRAAHCTSLVSHCVIKSCEMTSLYYPCSHQRHSFDNVNVIIFLPPISCFDEKLVEDRHVNRLKDSYLLWQAVCMCKWLAYTQMMLFLNKCNILHLKLHCSIHIRDSMPSFCDQKNDMPTATKCSFRSVPFHFASFLIV